ncbi:MAG: MutS-related protein [Planctomycetaceae bacterium]
MTALASSLDSISVRPPVGELPVSPSPARAEYQRRRDDFFIELQRLGKIDRKLSLSRLGLFVVGLGLAAMSLTASEVAFWWCVFPFGLFAMAIVWHERVLRRLDRCRRGIAYHETNIDRIEHRWHDAQPAGERYVDEHHPYEFDLDLFGKGSLFQLLCRARTRLGEDTLAEWLRSAASPSAIDFRQRAINELRGRVDLREELGLLPSEIHDSIDQSLLQDWASRAPRLLSRTWLVTAGLLGAAALITGFGWLLFDWPLAYFISVVTAELVLHFALRGLLGQVAHDIDRAESGIAILSQVLNVLEAERFQTPFLTALRSQLDTDRHPPSWQIRRLHRLDAWLDSSLHNQFFVPFAFLLCLPIWLSHAIERWRANIGPHIAQWLDAVGQFEAISSLAGYAFEHPADPFPEIVGPEAMLDAVGLGHPLIPEDRSVRNDLRCGRQPQLVMVSGSNMSGKSTLLRTIGSNVVLAFAGAPVRATKLKLSPFVLATSIRVHDSLLEGASLFFAVISRLKGIVERTGGQTPLLFLIDEILPGTNSHDRRVGAEAIIRQLLHRGAIGLVTTHDLALTDIVDQLGHVAINVHFEDRLEEGRMTFDYLLRPGIVRRSNALELMRLIGLGEPVDSGREPEADSR